MEWVDQDQTETKNGRAREIKPVTGRTSRRYYRKTDGRIKEAPVRTKEKGGI